MSQADLLVPELMNMLEQLAAMKADIRELLEARIFSVMPSRDGGLRLFPVTATTLAGFVAAGVNKPQTVALRFCDRDAQMQPAQIVYDSAQAARIVVGGTQTIMRFAINAAGAMPVTSTVHSILEARARNV